MMKTNTILLNIFILLFHSFIVHSQQVSKYIVVDQFGYLPGNQKVAIIRNPITGYDATESFIPSNNYALVHAPTGNKVFMGNPLTWNGGMEDPSSGDQIWWFDFSDYKTQGEYYVLDVDKNVRSHKFWISEGVYNEILKQAVRTFFYQRAGFEKKTPYAGEGWSDGASHVGTLQDKNCRLFNRKNDPGTEKDLHGGWYDAGDYNKYTNWTADYVVEMMKAYLENPEAWADNYNLPESGNGIPDLLDEAKWGMDHLLRLQLESGAVLSIVGLSSASPPSKATGQSLYGPETTSASLNTAAAFAAGAIVYKRMGLNAYADTLRARAIKAWKWAVANPEVLFRNNDSAYGSSGLGAGQQEESTYQRMFAKLEAAGFLFALTGDNEYRSFFDSNYSKANMFAWSFVFPFEMTNQDALLFYASLPNATASVSNHIFATYRNSLNNGGDNLPAVINSKDPYRAHIKDYTWGSNSTKAAQGIMYYDMIIHKMEESKNESYRQAAIGFLNYLHGVNPFGIVYLSNMYRYGGDNCVNEFYHTWFSDGSPLWDRVGQSAYGPPPGYLTGGPNPSYGVDGCCPSSCGSTQNNAKCNSENLTPPRNQPRQKSYKDFNTSWPLNSWSVTENSCGYQVKYIRLLSKFVKPTYDCSGESGGGAKFDTCGRCSGGNSGLVPVLDPKLCGQVTSSKETKTSPLITAWFDNTASILNIKASYSDDYHLKIVSGNGITQFERALNGHQELFLADFVPGFYVAHIMHPQAQYTLKFVIN